MEEQVKKLKNIFNLSNYEAKLYLAALNFDTVNLTDLARKAGLPRTAAYEPIKRLLNQGFLGATKIKKRTYYNAVDPKKLKYLLERKKVELDDMVSGLEKQIDIPERKLSISYYGGRFGIEMASDIMLEEAKADEMISWEEFGEGLKQHGKHQIKSYIKRRVEKGIKGKVIVSADPQDPVLQRWMGRDKEELRKCLLVNHKKYPVKAAIGVLDDTAVIMTFGNDPFAILIRNKDITSTLKSIHSMFWDRYTDT